MTLSLSLAMKFRKLQEWPQFRAHRKNYILLFVITCRIESQNFQMYSTFIKINGVSFVLEEKENHKATIVSSGVTVLQ